LSVFAKRAREGALFCARFARANVRGEEVGDRIHGGHGEVGRVYGRRQRRHEVAGGRSDLGGSVLEVDGGLENGAQVQPVRVRRQEKLQVRSEGLPGGGGGGGGRGVRSALVLLEPIHDLLQALVGDLEGEAVAEVRQRLARVDVLHRVRLHLEGLEGVVERNLELVHVRDHALRDLQGERVGGGEVPARVRVRGAGGAGGRGGGLCAPRTHLAKEVSSRGREALTSASTCRNCGWFGLGENSFRMSREGVRGELDTCFNWTSSKTGTRGAAGADTPAGIESEDRIMDAASRMSCTKQPEEAPAPPNVISARSS
jgi:hypothetical protein